MHAKQQRFTFEENYEDDSVELQVSQLIQFLGQEVSKIEDSLLGLRTYQKCLMQKGFLSLLDNMTEMLKSISGSTTSRRRTEAL